MNVDRWIAPDKAQHFLFCGAVCPSFSCLEFVACQNIFAAKFSHSRQCASWLLSAIGCNIWLPSSGQSWHFSQASHCPWYACKSAGWGRQGGWRLSTGCYIYAQSLIVPQHPFHFCYIPCSCLFTFNTAKIFTIASKIRQGVLSAHRSLCHCTPTCMRKVIYFFCNDKIACSTTLLFAT